MRGVRAQCTLHGGRVDGVSGLEGEEAEFGVEAGGNGGEVAGARECVAGHGAVGVELEVAD